jgi:hypothetical protein
MNDMLQEAIAGAPVTVTLGGESYPLAYPIQGVILYKSETAQLDRQRKLASGRAALTRDEKCELRDRRRELLADADAQRPAEGEKWNDKNYARFDEVFTEALALKTTLDEDAAAGDSLYDKQTWWKISPEGDPERLLLALWVGLHQFIEQSGKKVYTLRLSREDLGSLITLRNGEELTTAISLALRAHLIAPPEVVQEEALPNVQAAPPALEPKQAKILIK